MNPTARTRIHPVRATLVAFVFGASACSGSTQGTNYHPGVTGTGVTSGLGSLNGAEGSQSPVITSISPGSGYASGGTVVTLRGSSFQSSATVSLGGAPCREVQVLSATTLTCVTSSHFEGAVNVEVSNPNSQSFSVTGAFQYLAMPEMRNNLALGSVGGISKGSNVMLRIMGGNTGSQSRVFGSSLRATIGLVGTQAAH